MRWALRVGRFLREIYLDNGKQFFENTSKAEAKRQGIKLIYGRPYNSRGKGKIKSYHKVLFRELTCVNEFLSVSCFRKELQRFGEHYNTWRTQEILDWLNQVSV